MANHKSAKKRARQAVKRSAINQSYLSALKTALKGFAETLKAYEAGKQELAEVEKVLVKTQSAVDKSVTKGLFHRNKAARKISHLVAAFRRAQAAKA